MKAKILSIFAAVLLIACSSLGTITESREGQLVFQYATVKIIRESGDIDSGDILGFVERIRPLLTDKINTVDVVMSLVRSEVPWDRLHPEDRVLVNYIFEVAEDRLGDRATDHSDIRTSALTIIAWIEQAALFAGE